MKDKMDITAYELVESPMRLRTADRRRQWMDDLPERFSYRCLPLAIANQTGWEVLCPVSFKARWNGREGLDAISLKFHGDRSPLIGSHFGHGVLTFTPGYLFRTAKAQNLWVKGPTNLPKDGIAPLEGIVETDWAPFSFTINWQFTRRRHKVHFEEGEPIATVLPYPRHYIGKFAPKIRNLNEDAKLYNQYSKWRDDRTAFIEDLQIAGSDATKAGWQRTYMKGEIQEGDTFAGHQTKVRISDFKR